MRIICRGRDRSLPVAVIKFNIESSVTHAGRDLFLPLQASRGHIAVSFQFYNSALLFLFGAGEVAVASNLPWPEKPSAMRVGREAKVSESFSSPCAKLPS